jgi:hypothetical protein
MKFAAANRGGLFTETSPHEKGKHFLLPGSHDLDGGKSVIS